MFSVGQMCKLNKPPHIFEGIIIMPGQSVQIQKINEDGTYDLLFYDKEQMPHTMPSVSGEFISE